MFERFWGKRWHPVVISATLAAGSLLIPSVGKTADHVVIMTISTYARAPLPGVAHDSRNALQLADNLGYDTRNPTILKNEQLSAQGMRDALMQLAERVKLNDRLFFYYSGHGNSSLVDNQCVSSLVAHDETLIKTDEIKAYFDLMKGKVQDALIVMDSCFSGGLRELASSGARSSSSSRDLGTVRLASKSWQPKAGELCDQPTNVSKSWQVPQAISRGFGRPENNFTFIAAASEREVALDDQGRGGLATTSLLHCAKEGVPTQGLVTPSQLAKCAQQLVNASVPELNARHGTRWAAHTLDVSGNKERPLYGVKTRPAVQSTTNTNRADEVKDALKQIANSGSNGNWAFQVAPTANNVSLADPDQRRVVRFPYSSSQAGYGYVLYVGTDGKDMKQLFPEPGENNFLPAQGEFPALSIDPPAGANTYLFVMSQTPKDFDGIFQSQGNGAGETTAVQCELTKRNSGRVKVGNVCDDRRNSGRVPKPVQASGVLEGYAAQLIVVSGK